MLSSLTTLVTFENDESLANSFISLLSLPLVFGLVSKAHILVFFCKICLNCLQNIVLLFVTKSPIFSIALAGIPVH